MPRTGADRARWRSIRVAAGRIVGGRSVLYMPVGTAFGPTIRADHDYGTHCGQAAMSVGPAMVEASPDREEDCR